MKKLLSSFIVFLFLGLSAYSSGINNVLYSINDTLNTINRTENTYNRVKTQVKRNDNYSNKNDTNTNTNNSYQYPYQNNQTYTYPAQNTNYNYSENAPMELYGNYNQTNQGVTGQYVQTGNYNYSQTNVYRNDIATLGNLPAGAIVMDPKSVWNFRDGQSYSGEINVSHPVFWRKLEDNHYANNATLLLSELSVAKYPYCHRQKGLRDWAESDARRFLRTTFYTNLSDEFKKAIVNVNIPYADLNGNAKTVSDNLFLLSIVEWGLSDRSNNGKAIKYPNMPTIYDLGGFSYNKDRNTYEINYHNYGNMITRTINRPKASSAGYNSDVFVVKKGSLDTQIYWYEGQEIRPAVNIKSSTKIKGPYKFVYGNCGQKFLIYYILDFTE